MLQAALLRPYVTLPTDAAERGAGAMSSSLLLPRKWAFSRVQAAGGMPAQITHLRQSQEPFSDRWPAFLPDGRHFLFWGGNPDAPNAPNTGIFLGALDSTEAKFLVQADSNALYAPPGYLLYLRGETLMAQPFDAGSLKLNGDAFPLAEHVPSPAAYRLGFFTVSRPGLLAYETGQGAN